MAAGCLVLCQVRMTHPHAPVVAVAVAAAVGGIFVSLDCVVPWVSASASQ